MRKFLCCVLIVPFCMMCCACEQSVKIYSISPDTVMPLSDAADLLHGGTPLPDELTVSLADETVELPFAFYPEEKTLVVVYAKEETDETGCVVAAKGMLIVLNVPYKNTEEMVAQNYWSGTVMGAYPTGYISYANVCSTISSFSYAAPEDISGACFGIYCPDPRNLEAGVIHDFYKNPDHPYSYLGFLTSPQEENKIPYELDSLYHNYGLSFP